jgi:L-alanine-DL-glutamate epimerase-like enolase superfamily enzyme
MKIIELKAYPTSFPVPPENIVTLGIGRAVRPLEKPGVGVEVDEEFLVKHPVIEGPSYV